MTVAGAAQVLPVAWMALVLARGWQRRPGPPAVRAHLGSAVARASGGAPRFVRSVGHRLRRLARSAGIDGGVAADPAADGRVGAVAIAAALSVVAHPLLGVAVAMVGAGLPWWRRRADARRQVDEVVTGLPEVVDLFVLAVGAGLTVRLAVAAVADRAEGGLGAGLARATGRAAQGEPLADALGRLPNELGPALRPLVGALVATERYGTPLLPDLQRLAVEARLLRRRRAEVAARRLPVRLLFPLVLCTLPAFAVLTVVPFLLATFGSLHL